MASHIGLKKSLIGNSSLCALSLGAAAAWVALAPSAAAQSQSQEESRIGEIVVTAQFRAQALQETPIAITAITAEQIEQRGFTEAAELGYTVPNASFRPAQAAFGNTMTAFIRGIGQNDFDFAFEPGVAIYLDDMYHPFTLGSQIQLMDLERVEVLRGPQGTLFGRGAIGGAIRYISKKPQGDDTGSISATVGEFDRIDLRASYDFAIADNVAARITGAANTREGFQDVIDFTCAAPGLSGALPRQPVNQAIGCKVGTQGGSDYYGTRGILSWQADPSLNFTFSADYQKEISEPKADAIVAINAGAGAAYGGSVFNPPPAPQLPPYDARFIPPNPFVTYATYSDPRSGLSMKPENEFESVSATARADWEITDAVAAAFIFAYADIRSTLVTDADGSPLNVQTVNGVQNINYYTAEARLSGRIADRVDWTLGGFYYNGESVNDQIVSIPFLSFVVDGVPFTDPSRPFVNAHNSHENENKSVFVHTVWDITEQLSLTAGARYSEDEKLVDFNNTRVRNPNVVVQGESTDWRIGLDYQVSDDFLVYGSIATGYRPGSYNPRPFQWTQVAAVEAESSKAYELGVKADWFGGRLRTNLAGFYTDWETRIIPVGGTECIVINQPPGPPVYLNPVAPGTPGAVTDSLGNTCLTTTSRTFYQNSPGEVQGFEAELTWEPVDGLVFSGVYGRIKWDSPDIQGNATVVSDRPVYVPEQNWAVSASYTIEMESGASLTPRLDLYGQTEICTGTIFTTTANRQASCSAAYELLNARIEWRSPEDKWSLAVGATNLADETYFLNKFDLTAFGQPTAEGQPGAPREWYVTLGRRF
ncbi:MAG: TonB-dependent receptor [Hyphomonadaceae bacterium]|nr:TonB-dependent receptor [Hyphomonadaceae bacterium]